MYEEMMPSGKRIYELTARSMEIDKMANDGSSLCYELYVADFEQMADGFARKLNDCENRFFETFARLEITIALLLRAVRLYCLPTQQNAP
jgi:hypothetical protein